MAIENHDSTIVPRFQLIYEIIEREIEPDRRIRISGSLKEEEIEQVLNLVREKRDAYAWTVEEIERIPRNVSQHFLNVISGSKSIKQKKRHFAVEREMVVHEEVNKLLKTKFVREVEYPQWLANVVLVKKPNGKWRMCIDYTDLNRAFPKDCYPFSRIDALVDATARMKKMSFLDAFSSYHQIKIAENDEEKTSFITDIGTFCYTLMPFGLKNAGATYQCIVYKVFEKKIGNSIEAYVDDMVVRNKWRKISRFYGIVKGNRSKTRKNQSNLGNGKAQKY